MLTAAQSHQTDSIGLSIVIPVYNEEESLPHLHDALCTVLGDMALEWEILYCDDGSTDTSAAVIQALCDADTRIKLVRFRRNFGQTAAMAAGFEHARGDVVIPMDADLQNDPVDIPRLLAKLDEGFDVVSGWRADRQDNYWTVTLPSRLGNRVIGWFTGVALHDYGCTLTAYRADVLREIRLYGEMHRYLPAWAASVGARITELKVCHHARRWGTSKYSLRKAFRVLLDLITVRFLVAYRTKPLYFFGRLGLKALFGAFGCWTWTLIKRFTWGEPLYTDPFFLAGIFLALAGLQILLFGVLAELTMRTYYESQGKQIYVLKESVNVGSDEPKA